MNTLNEIYSNYVQERNLVCIPIKYIGYSNNKKETKFVKNWNKFTLADSNKYVNDTSKFKGIALLTGKINNFIVIDIDNIDNANLYLNKIGYSVDQLLKLDTPICKTRKGYHIYFNYTDSLSKSIIELKDCSNNSYKIDLLSNGKLSIIPPTEYTIENSKIKYNWINSIDNTNIIDIPKKIKKYIIKNNYKSDIPKNITNINTSENSEIYNLIYKIINSYDIQRASNYEDWLKVCFCLKNISEKESIDLWSIFDSFSRKAMNKYDSDNNFKIWENTNINNKIGYGSLWYWLKEDNLNEYNNLKKTDTIPIFDFDNIFCDILINEFDINSITNIIPKGTGWSFNAVNSRCLCDSTSNYFELYNIPNETFINNIFMKCSYCTGKKLLLYVDSNAINKLENVLDISIKYALKLKSFLYIYSVDNQFINLDLYNLEITSGNGDITYIHSDKPLKIYQNLSNLFPTITECINDWELTRLSETELLISSDFDQKPRISIYFPDDQKRISINGEITINNKTKKVNIKKKDSKFILDIVSDTIINYLIKELEFPSSLLDHYSRTDDSIGKFTDLAIIEKMDELKLLDNIIITSGEDLYWFMERTKTWILTNKDKISNPLIKKYRDICKDNLTNKDIKYIESTSGASNIMRKLVSDINRITLDKYKIDKFDNNPYLIPFDNYTYDLKKHILRPIELTDYITETTGYAIRPRENIPKEEFDFIESIYNKILPDPEDREFFLRLVGSCISKTSNEKIFVILTDQLKGNNGKSTIMKGIMYALGELSKKGDPSLIYESHAESVNGHQQGYIAYKNKRLIFIDETSSTKQLATGRVKNLTSGADNKFSARRIHSSVIETFEWTGSIFICCNKGDFSTFKCKDSALLNRMRVVPFKSEFRFDIDEDIPEQNIYKIDNTVTEKFKLYREAHLYVLIDAYKKYEELGLVDETKYSKMYKNALMCDSDSLYGNINDFLNNYTEIKEHSVVPRKELVNGFIMRYEQFNREKKDNIEDAIDKYMVFNKIKFYNKVKINGTKRRNIYVGVELLMQKKEEVDSDSDEE